MEENTYLEMNRPNMQDDGSSSTEDIYSEVFVNRPYTPQYENLNDDGYVNLYTLRSPCPRNRVYGVSNPSYYGLNSQQESEADFKREEPRLVVSDSPKFSPIYMNENHSRRPLSENFSHSNRGVNTRACPDFDDVQSDNNLSNRRPLLETVSRSTRNVNTAESADFSTIQRYSEKESRRPMSEHFSPSNRNVNTPESVNFNNIQRYNERDARRPMSENFSLSNRDANAAGRPLSLHPNTAPSNYALNNRRPLSENGFPYNQRSRCPESGDSPNMSELPMFTTGAFQPISPALATSTLLKPSAKRARHSQMPEEIPLREFSTNIQGTPGQDEVSAPIQVEVPTQVQISTQTATRRQSSRDFSENEAMNPSLLNRCTNSHVISGACGREERPTRCRILNSHKFNRRQVMYDVCICVLSLTIIGLIVLLFFLVSISDPDTKKAEILSNEDLWVGNISS